MVMKEIIDLKSLKFALFLVTSAIFAVSCGDDEEVIGKGGHDPIEHYYSGECIFSADIDADGINDWCDTVPGNLSVITVKNVPVAIGTVCIDSLFISPMRMIIDKMEPFYIDDLVVNPIDANKFAVDQYQVSNVPCTMRGTEGVYDATGMASGVFTSAGVEVSYSFRLGRMPLSIIVEFKGTELH